MHHRTPPPPISFDDELLGVGQVAQRFGVSTQAVYRWMRDAEPRLPHTKIAKRFVTNAECVSWWMRERQLDRQGTDDRTSNVAKPTHEAIDAECRRAGI